MKLIANIIWFIFGGLWLGLGWGLLGILLCITIIGIPFGKQCFKAAKLSFAPFGKKVNLQYDKHPVANVIWAILFGWELAIGYLISGVICCNTPSISRSLSAAYARPTLQVFITPPIGARYSPTAFELLMS